MAVIFPRWTNYLPFALMAGAPLVGALLIGAVTYYGSPWNTDVGYQPEQPVPFSHKLHAGELGLDCRYCHSTVEVAAHAAIPPTSTCMNCHSTVKADSEKLQLIRESASTGAPVEWVRVHMLPDYAFFNHSVHVAAGVGCTTCHGRIDQMEVVRQEKPLSMAWCLECHRSPTEHLRPRTEITNMGYDPVAAGYAPDKDPERQRTVDPPKHCSGCHR